MECEIGRNLLAHARHYVDSSWFTTKKPTDGLVRYEKSVEYENGMNLLANARQYVDSSWFTTKKPTDARRYVDSSWFITKNPTDRLIRCEKSVGQI